MENADDTPLKSQLVLSVLPLIHSRRVSLEIVALVGDIIAADARMNIWACEVEHSTKELTVERWMGIVKFFEDAETECQAAVRRFDEGGDPADLTDALRRVLAKFNERPSLEFDWSAFDAMTEEEVLAAALSDPDAQPLTDADMKRMKRTPQVKVIRRAFGMSLEEFAKVFRIPIGTLRDWEQGRVEPDQAARAYLKVIARDPKAVRKALEPA